MRILALLCAACTSANGAPAPPEVPPQTPALGDPAAPGRVVAVQIAASAGNAPASDRPVRARAGEAVTLYAVITVEHAGARTIYSDAPSLELRGARVAAQPLARAPQLALHWNRIEPAVANMSNGDTPADFHYEPIDYRATAIAAAAGRASIAADVRPTLTTTATASARCATSSSRAPAIARSRAPDPKRAAARAPAGSPTPSRASRSAATTASSAT